MNLKYFVIKGKNKYTSIYVRFWDSNRIDQKTTTGISTLFEDWSPVKQKIKIRANSENTDLLNDKLEKLSRYIFDKYNLDYNNKVYISKTWLKETIKNHFGRVSENENHKIYFVDWVSKFVETAPKRIHNGQPIKERTLKNYTSAYNKLIAFEKLQNKKYRFEEIDLNFHRDFVFFCSQTVGLNNNSTGSIIARIKTFCKNIEYDGFPINPKYKHKDFSIPKEPTFDIYLTEIEIQSILKHDFTENERLDNARDLFIIGLRTGLRISDFLRITEENKIGSLINITTLKTNQNLTIPIHPDFNKILSKRNGEFPRKISNQHFNKYIKEICQEVKIGQKTFGSKMNKETKTKKQDYYEKWELVTSHVCRRSFTTLMYLDGVEISVIRSATGHSDDKTLLHYVKANKLERLNKLQNYYSEQEKLKNETNSKENN